MRKLVSRGATMRVFDVALPHGDAWRKVGHVTRNNDGYRTWTAYPCNGEPIGTWDTRALAAEAVALWDRRSVR